MASKSVVNNGSLLRFHQVIGDLFSCPDTSSIAHCISADCEMGMGIAVAFRKKFGQVDELLDQGKTTGDVAILQDRKRYIYYLVTKPKYWHKPTYETLEKSLLAMKEHCKQNEVKELSMPKIGCGLDLLSWGEVSGMIMDIFKDIDMSITVYDIGSKGGNKYRKSKNVGENDDWRSNNTRSAPGDRSQRSSDRHPPYYSNGPRNPTGRGPPQDERRARPLSAPDFETDRNPNRSGPKFDGNVKDLPKKRTLTRGHAASSGTSSYGEPSAKTQEDYVGNQFNNHYSKKDTDQSSQQAYLPVGAPAAWLRQPKKGKPKNRKNLKSQEPQQNETNAASQSGKLIKPQADKSKASQSGKFHEKNSGTSNKSRAANSDRPQAVMCSSQQSNQEKHVGEQTTEPLLEGKQTNQHGESKNKRRNRSNDTNKTRNESHSEAQNSVHEKVPKLPLDAQESCAVTHQQQKGKQNTKKPNVGSPNSQQTEMANELEEKKKDRKPGNKNEKQTRNISEPQNSVPNAQESCAATHEHQKGKQKAKKPNVSAPNSQQTEVANELQEKRNDRKPGNKNEKQTRNISEPQNSVHEPVPKLPLDAQESCAATHEQQKGKQKAKKSNISAPPNSQQTEVTNELQDKKRNDRKPTSKNEKQAQNISQQQKQEMKNKERPGETPLEFDSQSTPKTQSKKRDSDCVATVNTPVDIPKSCEQQSQQSNKKRKRNKTKGKNN